MRNDRWRALLDPRWLVFAAVAAVAVFAFVVSYSHIYDLGRQHAQSGTAARLLPLSVDLLIVAATLVLFIQGPVPGTWRVLGWWKPRVTLWAAIGATVAANVFYGLPSGWLAAVISGWPGVAFVAAVEVAMVVARPVPQTGGQIYKPAAVSAGYARVPASAAEAARLAYAASVEGGNPLPARQLMVRFGIKRGEADKIRGQGGPPASVLAAQVPAGAVPPAGAGLNGAGAHG